MRKKGLISEMEFDSFGKDDSPPQGLPPECISCGGRGCHEDGDAADDGGWKRAGYTECDDCQGTGYRHKRDQMAELARRAMRAGEKS